MDKFFGKVQLEEGVEIVEVEIPKEVNVSAFLDGAQKYFVLKGYDVTGEEVQLDGRKCTFPVYRRR